jgi:aspartate aminotransferase-like enzyme
MQYHEKYILNDKNTEKEILEQVFDNQKITPDNFYRTGYEYIPFARERRFALETVITSVVDLNRNIIIFDSGKESSLPVEICLKNDIKYSIVNAKDNKADIGLLERLLSDSGTFSHVCISLTNESLYNFDLGETIKLISRNNLGIIIDYSGDVKNLVDIDINSFDFLASNTNKDDVSFVAARRSKLVQTEGNARSYSMDLYGFWQETLKSRHRAIRPVAF